MAAIIKKKSGINPLTINQVDWLETHCEKTVNPYRVVIDKNPPKEISVFKNSKEQYFSTEPKNQDINDIFIHQLGNYTFKSLIFSALSEYILVCLISYT
jgi:type III secretory pathway component EscR